VLHHGCTDHRELRGSIGIGFLLFLFHNGGSPHGMMPSPGLRKVVGRIPAWALFASVALGVFGKGKPRLLNLAWAVALAFVRYAIFMLEMDWSALSSDRTCASLLASPHT
jgi:hypothetical protein